jgi:hypothetical protein
MSRQHAAASALFIALSVLMTWPLAPNLNRAVSDPGDPYITIWILDWDFWATIRQPLSLFDANAFYPAQYSLAFTENLYGIAVFLFPLRALGVGPIAAHNIALLAGFAFSGFAAYLLGRKLTGFFVAGIAAGIFYAFVPFRFVHLSHVQHISGGWLPFLLFALLHYADSPTRRRAVVFALAFVFNGLTNVHYLFFGAFAAAVTALVVIPRSAWKELLVATAGALLLLAPFLYPYFAASKLYGMERTWEEVFRFSAVPSDWLPGAAEPERRIFPGFLAFVAVAGALLFARGERAKLALASLWCAIGFFGSLGLHFAFHEFLFGAVPGFKAIRVPARWAVIAYVGIAIFVALLTYVIAKRNRWAAWIVPIAFIAELFVAPIRWYVADPAPRAVDTWLAAQPSIHAIVELPLDGLGTEYAAMLGAATHHKKMVNGISGFAPPLRMELSALANQKPVPDEFLARLRAIGVDAIVVHQDALGDDPNTNAWLDRELARGEISFVAAFDRGIRGDQVYRIGKGGAARRPLQPPCREMLGALNDPPPEFTFPKGAIFSGWAISAHGIQSIDLLFNSRRVRYPATIRAAALEEHCRAHADVTRMGFVALFDSRPADVHRVTDVQVEVTDGRGRKTVFEDRWIQWN